MFDPSLDQVLKMIHDSGIEVTIEISDDGGIEFRFCNNEQKGPWHKSDHFKDMTEDISLAAVLEFPDSTFTENYGDQLKSIYKEIKI